MRSRASLLPLASLGLLAVVAVGCQGPPSNTRTGHTGTHQSNSDAGKTPETSPPTKGGGGGVGGVGGTLGLLDGRAVSIRDLRESMIEGFGGQALAELVLHRMVDQRLHRKGLTLTQADLDRERQLFAATLDPDDPQRAARLLTQVRDRRGLGAHRFQRLLHRNAGLRKLIAERVEVSEEQVNQAFQLAYGPRYEVRLILTKTLRDASNIAKLATRPNGDSFTTLAIQHSTDVSKRQGGLLPPISPVDESYPLAIRKALPAMKVGQVSAPIAVEGGFALLKLERVVAGRKTEIGNVRDALAKQVRLQSERIEMQRLARTLLREADLVVLDRALKKRWDQQRGRVIDSE